LLKVNQFLIFVIYAKQDSAISGRFMREFEREGIVVRATKPDDFDALFKLRKELFHEELEDAGVPPDVARQHTSKWSLDGATPTWSSWLDNPQEYSMATVTHKGNLAGVFMGAYSLATIEISELSKNESGLYVASVQLHPEVRRKGLGRFLIKEFMEARPREPTYLHVLEKNQPARSFYRALGFAAIGQTEIKIANLYPLQRILMKKEGEGSS
jgi:ribosomal protein S18 acetylase RimI-like enzyme